MVLSYSFWFESCHNTYSHATHISHGPIFVLEYDATGNALKAMLPQVVFQKMQSATSIIAQL